MKPYKVTMVLAPILAVGCSALSVAYFADEEMLRGWVFAGMALLWVIALALTVPALRSQSRSSDNFRRPDA